MTGDFTEWSVTALDLFIQERYARIANLRREMDAAQREAEQAAKVLRGKLARPVSA